MREIKFRGWDSESQEMLPTQDLTQSSEYWGWLGKKDVILMQYTGLKDKNGREIYEGDIVKCSSGCPHKIEFTMIPNHNFGGMPGFYLFGLNSGYSWTDKEEVIGNIHETPELLEK